MTDDLVALCKGTHQLERPAVMMFPMATKLPLLRQPGVHGSAVHCHLSGLAVSDWHSLGGGGGGVGSEEGGKGCRGE